MVSICSWIPHLLGHVLEDLGLVGQLASQLDIVFVHKSVEEGETRFVPGSRLAPERVETTALSSLVRPDFVADLFQDLLEVLVARIQQ